MSIATLKRKTRNTSPRYPISDGRFSIIGGYRNRGGVGRFPMIGSDNYVSFNDSSYIKSAVVNSSSKAVLHPCGSGSAYNIYIQEKSQGTCCCTGYPKEVVKSYIIAGDREDPNTSKGFSANNTDSSTYITAKKLLNNNTICRSDSQSTNNSGNSCCQKDTAKVTKNTPMSSSEYLESSSTPKPLCGGKLLPFPIWINNNCHPNFA